MVKIMDNDIMCTFCSEMLDYDSTTGEYLCSCCGNDLVNHSYVQVIDDEIFTLKCVALTNEIGFDSLKKMIEFLGGSATFMTCNGNGPLKLLLKDESKLLKSLKLKAEDLNEVTFEAEFFATRDKMPKETVMAEIFNVFPVCIIREEDSKYFIASNKGLASLISNEIEDDVSRLYAQFITGFEKASALSYYLTGLNDVKDETMVSIEQTLVVANEIMAMQNIPYKLSESLASADKVVITNSTNDPGTEVSFSVMLKELLDDEDSEPVICSVRGIANYLIKETENEDKQKSN